MLLIAHTHTHARAPHARTRTRHRFLIFLYILNKAKFKMKEYIVFDNSTTLVKKFIFPHFSIIYMNIYHQLLKLSIREEWVTKRDISVRKYTSQLFTSSLISFSWYKLNEKIFFIKNTNYECELDNLKINNRIENHMK